LIVEDEPMIAMLLEDYVDLAGHKVAGSVSDLNSAAAAVAAGGFDAAILDVHLGGDPVWPVADELAAGGIPFLISSGTSREAIPDRFADRPMLAKPYTLAEVEKALAELG